MALRADRSKGRECRGSIGWQPASDIVDNAGRYLRHTAYPQTQELPVFKRSYRILYLVKEADGIVEVLRFWHSHREEPFQD